MPRFVVLTHDHPCLHWDLMLEEGDALRTWRLEKPPENGTPIEAEPLSDHRLAYLDYEGPVSGDRGTVARWDRGTYEVLESALGCLIVRLAGDKLDCVARLEQRLDGAGWLFQALPSPRAGS